MLFYVKFSSTADPTLRPSHAGQALLFSLDHHGASAKQQISHDLSKVMANLGFILFFFAISTGFNWCVNIYIYIVNIIVYSM